MLPTCKIKTKEQARRPHLRVEDEDVCFNLVRDLAHDDARPPLRVLRLAAHHLALDCGARGARAPGGARQAAGVSGRPPRRRVWLPLTHPGPTPRFKATPTHTHAPISYLTPALDSALAMRLPCCCSLSCPSGAAAGLATWQQRGGGQGRNCRHCCGRACEERAQPRASRRPEKKREHKNPWPPPRALCHARLLVNHEHRHAAIVHERQVGGGRHGLRGV